MKKVQGSYLLRLFFIAFISFFLHYHIDAQPWPNDPWSSGGGAGTEPGEPGTNDPPDDPQGFPDPDLPLDSNVLILVAVVVGYGLKKIWDVKRNAGRKNNNIASAARFEDFIK